MKLEFKPPKDGVLPLYHDGAQVATFTEESATVGGKEWTLAKDKACVARMRPIGWSRRKMRPLWPRPTVSMSTLVPQILCSITR